MKIDQEFDIIKSKEWQLSTQGAQLFHWQPSSTKHPVLFCSSKAEFEKGKSIRGGIPICWPWFGPKENNQQHGFIRKINWALVSQNERHIILTSSSDEATKSIWPHDYFLQLDIRALDELALTLTIKNMGESAFEFTSALHTYFYVGSIKDLLIQGLQNVTYTDKTENYNTYTQQGLIAFEGETDRIYHSSEDIYILDPILDRVIKISNTGCNSTVVWNPWHKAETIKDMDPSEFNNFVCVENGCIQPSILLNPGQEHVCAIKISLQ